MEENNTSHKEQDGKEKPLLKESSRKKTQQSTLTIQKLSTQSDSNLGKFPSSDTLIHVITNLDMPIAVRKEVWSCTQHSISNFISYESLSPSYKAFVSGLSCKPIPSNWKNATKNPKMKGGNGRRNKSINK